MVSKILAIVITLYTLIIFYQYEKINTLKLELTEIKIESDRKIAEVKNANDQAKKEEKEDEEDTGIIMLSHVPESCDAAIGWGIEEAKEFNV